jgi:hypothetical protein
VSVLLYNLARGKDNKIINGLSGVHITETPEIQRLPTAPRLYSGPMTLIVWKLQSGCDGGALLVANARAELRKATHLIREFQ